MPPSIPTPPEAEVLADDLHLLRLFCQIADYEVVGGIGNERVPEARLGASDAAATTEPDSTVQPRGRT